MLFLCLFKHLLSHEGGMKKLLVLNWISLVLIVKNVVTECSYSMVNCQALLSIESCSRTKRRLPGGKFTFLKGAADLLMTKEIRAT
ncbi:hypothetical protein RIF29_17608 [Crotalaria pallida]|uniref:Secreted protein n=1 Tax=Crotalaria pallida TaxID=3830 RepID=A0AAN9FIP3_CROPI